MASRPKFWPRQARQARPRGFGIGLASISLYYYVIGHFSCKNRVKFGNFVNFPTVILNHILLIIIWYFFIIIFGLVALVSASRFWPRLYWFGISRTRAYRDHVGSYFSPGTCCCFVRIGLIIATFTALSVSKVIVFPPGVVNRNSRLR